MKAIKILTLILFATSMMAGSALAGDGCCPAKAAEQKKCAGEQKACPKDAKSGCPKGQSGEKSQPAKAPEKAKDKK